MKKLFVLLLSFYIFLSFPKAALAYEQTEGVCYSQCAAYKFGWRGDFCWDLFTNQCSVSSKSALKNFIKLVKDTAESMAKGKLMTIIDVSESFKAMFVCKPLIEDCIAPELQDCTNTCKNISKTYYSPELSVGNPFGSVYYHNVYYDENKHELTFKVVNYGGYAWDIDVSASWGHTPNRDKKVSGGGTLFTEKIPELVFAGARIGSPKTPGDYIADFLIDQSNFSKYLQKFKSDADNHYIPPVWYKTVSFTAPAGEYTKVILNVDPNKLIPEANEEDNTYILEIDQLPTPASFLINNLTWRRTDSNSLTNYLVDFELKNQGEETERAYVKWYLGQYSTGAIPFHEQEMVVQGKNKVNFSHIFNVDVADGGSSCSKSQIYTLVVFDDDNLIKTQQTFSIPKYAGSISGRVEDLFGKKVIGAVVKTNTGQTAEVNNMGYYHLKGIPIRGKVTLTATHPDFSEETTKEVEIKFIPNENQCDVDGLTHTNVNFVLKDQDVVFTIIIKDTTGNPIKAHVLANNSNWRFDQEVEGQSSLPGMQPGKYNFLISALGYKTVSQTVNAVPNEQNLEFVLEKLNGRDSDNSLTILDTPKLLWQRNRGEEILSQITATKNGKELLIYTTRNKENSGKLYFLNLQTGKEIKIISSTISTKGQSQACLSTSYDGDTTMLYVHIANFGIAGKTKNTLKLFNNQAQDFGTIEFPSGGGIGSCDVSPDGFYVYADRLLNKSLYVYTQYDILGLKNRKEKVSYAPHEAIHFTTQNQVVAGCHDSDGDQCVQTIFRNLITNLGQFTSGARAIDSSQNASKIGLITTKKAYLFKGNKKLWEKNIQVFGDFPDLSVSPGGQYVIYSTVDGNNPYRTIKIFTSDNINKTPANLPSARREDVVFVHANDQGIYFLTEQQKKLKLYQVGIYGTDYNPTSKPSVTPQVQVFSLSYWQKGNFYPAGGKSFAQLEDGVIYLANQNVTLDMGNGNGSLRILSGTLFSVNNNHPILLKGQLTADFSSPAIIYAIKFNRYDLNLFQNRLNEFRATTLADNEYFVVKNIHTKFTVSNTFNRFNVAVENGQVSVIVDNKEKLISFNRQITVDAENRIRESLYFGRLGKFWVALLVIGVGAALFFSIKIKVGKAMIKMLKIMIIFIL